ncbi:DUF2169 domain-containing protein [Thorsellia kenyensis]|uniref:DUF2169 domain-containing protein n=1 Tax=Thorsellia kenyensis TaxID=1549888 RepID=A0ABV6C9G9_9GAMM
MEKPEESVEPIAFCAISRSHPNRLKYAGTYDDIWRRTKSPFLPDDFDNRSFQCAPQNQIIAYPIGGESVELVNLIKGYPLVQFKLPKLNKLPLRILKTDYEALEIQPVVDTLYFEPYEQRFSVVWRSSIPLKRNIHEIKLVAIGYIGKNWWQERRLGINSCSTCRSIDSNIDKSNLLIDVMD